MHLHLRALATTFIAAIALAAVAAPSAEAFEFFKAEEQLTSFRGTQSESADFKFPSGIGAGEIICGNGSLRGMYVREGMEKSPQRTKTLDTSDSAKPGVEYTSCVLGTEKVTFASNHCNYRFYAEKETIDVIKNGSATEESECEKSGMTFTTATTNCVVSIKPGAENMGRQNSNAFYKNSEKMGKEQFVFFIPSVTKIKYSTTKACKKAGTFEDGEYLRGTQEVLGFTGTEFNTRAGLFME